MPDRKSAPFLLFRQAENMAAGCRLRRKEQTPRRAAKNAEFSGIKTHVSREFFSNA
jgi:hypothetical protein